MICSLEPTADVLRRQFFAFPLVLYACCTLILSPILLFIPQFFFQLDSRAFVCRMRFLPEAFWDFFKLLASVNYSVLIPRVFYALHPYFEKELPCFLSTKIHTLIDSCVTTVFLEAFQTCFSLVDSLWYFSTDPRELSNPCVTIVIFGTLFNCLPDESVTRVTWTPGLGNGNQYAKTFKGGTPCPKESKVNTNLCKTRNNNELT